jgi:hypothetical protein
LTNESIALALPCVFQIAQRVPEIGLAPVNGEDASAWEGARILVIRESQSGDSVLVALVKPDAAPLPFRADYEAGTVDTPDGEFSLSEFQTSFFRCDANGEHVANFFDPAWVQMQDARAAGSESHQADITELVELRRRSDQVADQVDWRMFDILMSGETDGLTADEALAKARFRNDAPIHLVHGLEGLVSFQAAPDPDFNEEGSVLAEQEQVPDLILEGWSEIRAYPQYLIDGVRVIFKRFLSDRIGDTPIEEIVRLEHPPGEMDAMARVFEQEGFEDMGISPPFQDSKVMRGGYSTSEVRNFRGNGVDVILFEDFRGSYAYAWPEQPTAKPKIVARH